MSDPALKLLFILNTKSGTSKPDWQQEIAGYFENSAHGVEIYTLPHSCNPTHIQQKIYATTPDRVIAVGGDGTVKLVAETATKTSIPMGILPAGSANGMAKELQIPNDPTAAIDIVVHGQIKKIDAIVINGEMCIHLADIGFNAFLVKTFESLNSRGMFGYFKAAWKVLLRNRKMTVKIASADSDINREAQMIVIANASKYGTGAVINPEGKLDDGLFELIVMKKISFQEIFKMMVTHKPYNSDKIEVFTTRSVTVQSKYKAHFQVDGEYLGKVKKVEAVILPGALEVMVPV